MSAELAGFDPAEQVDGAELLDRVEGYLGRFVAFPSEHARVAVTLWAAHCHLVERFESTPRLAFLSPEPGSGKTRSLEVLDLLVPAPMHALNAAPAPTFRSLAAARRTLLFDEVDALFGRRPGGGDDPAADLRALLNAGHRRGATIPRCVGPRHDVVDFPVFAAVALAGLGDLPDTLMSRSVIVRMRRRAPGETVEPFRRRLHAAEGEELRKALARWAETVADEVADAWPDLPEGITDRPADVWEPLLAVAEAAGGDWPERARDACVELVKAAQTTDSGSLGIRLLADLRAVFGGADALHGDVLLDKLHGLEESPWADLRGKPLDARGLARRLRDYGVRSQQVWADNTNRRGYRREDLHDAWTRYLPEIKQQQQESDRHDEQRDESPGAPSEESARSARTAKPQVSDPPGLADAEVLADASARTPVSAGDDHASDLASSGPSTPSGPAGAGLRLAAWTPARQPIGECLGCGQPTPTVDELRRPCHVTCEIGESA